MGISELILLAGAAIFAVLAVVFWANDRTAEAITCVTFALFLFFFGLSNGPKPTSGLERLQQHKSSLCPALEHRAESNTSP